MTDALAWPDVVDAARRLGRNAFVSSVDDRGEPHLAIVWVPVVDEHLCFVTDRYSRKARNLAARPALALHWQVTEHGPNAGEQLFVRGEAAFVMDEPTRLLLWESGAWGDLSQWYAGIDDPRLAFVRVRPRRVSLVGGFGAGPIRRWRSA